MPIVLLLIGAALIVAAYKNTQGNVGSALAQDVPGFAAWFLALALIGGIGYVPGMRVPSRWLIALVMLVLFLTSYKQILAGFKHAASGASQGAAAAGPADPASSYAANPAQPNVTEASIQGTSGAGPPVAPPGPATAASTMDPSGFLRNWASQSSQSLPGLAIDLASIGFGGAA